MSTLPISNSTYESPNVLRDVSSKLRPQLLSIEAASKKANQVRDCVGSSENESE